ncbi:hypothetical protein [Aliarcobacter butzleri]|uniref:hypothetical protein n=1 Tax=Aliarcobacter butzleri TaxID=28197 RepID=UPI0021B4A9CC|nr:hypothetical protein [Aliarcobacter butzleri]MCT7649153.1 hypothetical protein [Aliarcobacter butzleri]
MFRFLLGVVTGFVAKKYYDENKEEVNQKIKKVINIIDTYSMDDKKIVVNGDIYSQKEQKNKEK